LAAAFAIARGVQTQATSAYPAQTAGWAALGGGFARGRPRLPGVATILLEPVGRISRLFDPTPPALPIARGPCHRCPAAPRPAYRPLARSS